MRPYYEADGITIYHGDCREVLPTLQGDIAIISDPPYGIGWDADTRRFSGGKIRLARGRARRPVAGDDEPFDPSHLLHAEVCVLWGANHFARHLPPGTWLVWAKKPPERYGAFLSDAEVAWMRGGRGVYIGRIGWEGLNRETEHGQHYHPTQKPVQLMRWCIERALKGRTWVAVPRWWPRGRWDCRPWVSSWMRTTAGSLLRG